MKSSRLPPGGKNIFQAIKEQRLAAQAKGIKIIDLSIGQPTGPAMLSARSQCAHLVMSYEQNMHEYQDNGCLPTPLFAEKFAAMHFPLHLAHADNIDFLPIPGIKPMLPLVILACGLDSGVKVRGMTNPGYGVPATWCGYLGRLYRPLLTTPENGFRFSAESIGVTDLLMTNYPHNPTGQISTREFWLEVCAYCEEHNIRIFNDGAYAILADDEHVTLAEIAIQFPNLSWAEAFSASKAGNFTGWRIGAIVGSKDFVSDIRTIKGNTDSGFFAPAAIAILSAFGEQMPEIIEVGAVYRHRLNLLKSVLQGKGMQLAVDPRAGFFSLWSAPKRAFDQEIVDANHFNELMIDRTGVVGVPFGSYIRYAVVGDVEAMMPDIERGFDQAFDPQRQLF